MVVPNWFIRLLTVLGLKESPEAKRRREEAEVAQMWRELHDKRARYYGERDVLAKKVARADAAQKSRKLAARELSDRNLNAARMRELDKILAGLNTVIMQQGIISSSQELGGLLRQIQNLETGMARAGAIQEGLAGQLEDSGEELGRIGSVSIVDPSLAAPAGEGGQADGKEREKAAETDKPVSENESHLVSE